MNAKRLVGIAVLGIAAGLTAFANSGKILLMNDEWTLSDTGFSTGADAGQFARNIGSWATGGSTGNFLAYSTNFGLTGSGLSSTMTSAGHSWTVGTATTFNLPTLSSYNAIFLSGNAADNQVLINYVNAGGTVILEGGTGWAGSAAEAAQWNTFLNAFGLGFGSSYNGVEGNIAISNPHTLFQGVNSLYQNNGNDALDINISDPNAKVLASLDGHGLYAVYEQQNRNVPDASNTLALLSGAIVGVLFLRRRYFA
ncbi:MAG: VPDSG-CTERM sorting domain-containing protein [Verrucomicrobia bacterium]|nr:VPDSG-CTERM sorting domain-containing protein [Verrucomicrobiota bacterium]